MQFLHYELSLKDGAIVEVELDKQANIQLMDDVNFMNYRARRSFRFTGGLAKRSPYRLSAPRAGRWHLAIDMGGYSGSVRASVRTIS